MVTYAGRRSYRLLGRGILLSTKICRVGCKTAMTAKKEKEKGERAKMQHWTIQKLTLDPPC